MSAINFEQNLKAMVNRLVDSLTVSFLWFVTCIIIQIFWYIASPLLFPGFATLLKDKRSVRRAWYNRGVSAVHAAVIFCMTSYYWIYVNPTVKISIHEVTRIETLAVDVMMGYLWYDLLFEMLYTRQLDSMGHHILGIISHLSTRLSGNSAASFYSMLVFIAEGSTPFLNSSWLMHQLQLKDTIIFKLTALSLVTSFLVFRIILGPFMVTHMLHHRNEWGNAKDGLMFWGNFFIVFLFAVLNFYWFYKLMLVFLGFNAPAKVRQS